MSTSICFSLIDVIKTLIIVAVIQAVDLPPFHFNILRSIRMFVQIDTVAQSWRTASVKLTKREGARWEEKFTMCVLMNKTDYDANLLAE